ncbi:hypothetical protein [Kribbella sp. NPDC048928]|uniref:hypothetical protein n=1 Tax=Kribbella sp. NPDC048928 TaxID=3364111 RepID=UPI003719323E
MDTSKRRIALVAGIAVTVAAASVGGVNGWDRWKSRCSAHVAETPAKVLRSIQARPADQVDLAADRGSDSINPNAARGVLASARKPGGGFSPATRVLVSGADGRSADSVQSIGTADGDPILAVGPPAWVGSALKGSVVVLDRHTGQARWGRQYFGDAVQGRQLPGRMMVLQLTSRPMAASFATADGDITWCTWVGTDPVISYPPTFTSDAEDGQLYVVREPAEEAGDRSVLLSRIDGTSGKIAWEQPVDGVDRLSSLDTFGDQLLLSRWDPQMYVDDRWAALSGRTDPNAGAVVARSAATGDATWTYDGPDPSGWIVNVIGVRDDTAVVVARRVKADPKTGGPAGEALNQSWLIGLDRTGKERWRQDLGSALVYTLADDAKVADDVVITDESKSTDPKVRLVARDLTTGKVRWTKMTSRSGPTIKLEVSTVIDHQLVAAGANPRGGLQSIDLTTGSQQAVLTDGDIRNIVGDNKSITFVADGLVFTLDHT